MYTPGGGFLVQNVKLCYDSIGYLNFGREQNLSLVLGGPTILSIDRL